MLKHKVLAREQKKLGFFTLEDMTVEHSLEEKKTKTYSIIRHPDWVNVIAQTSDHRFILVEQWRAGVDALSMEIPGGKIDEGETPIEAGLRELIEETGYSATSDSKIMYLGDVLANPAIQDNKMHFVYINNVQKNSQTDMDEFEVVHTHIVPKDKIIDMLSSGRIQHAYSVLGLYKTLKG
jgi:8-oxo-dGTP pyrophosphatase MutT (NUDIX family)